MKIELVRLFDIYAPLLNERQQEILFLHYNEDQSLAEIAENVGITRQGVRDCIVKSEALLLGYEKALRLYGRFSEISSKLDELAAIAEGEDENGPLTKKISEIKDMLV